MQLALVLGVALFAAGCGKKEGPQPAANTPSAPQNPAQPATPNAASPPAAPVTPPPAPVDPVVAASANAEEGILQRLNQAVMGYRRQKNSYPNSVEEVAAFAGIQLPPPPPGKKYAFNGRGLIVFVDDQKK